MRKYDTIIILKPQLSDSEVAEFIEKTKKTISQDGGEVISEEKMGRRKLSHPINKTRDGFYSYMKFRAAPAFVSKFMAQMKVNESVLRAAVLSSMEKELKVAPAKVA